MNFESEFKKLEHSLHTKQNRTLVAIVIAACILFLLTYRMIEIKNEQISVLNSKISELQFEQNSSDYKLEFVSLADSIINTSNKNVSVSERNLIANNIWSSAREFNVSPHLVLAVMKVESNFKSNARSHAGACGLMQMLPATFKMCRRYLGESSELTNSDSNIYNIENQIRYGTMYLRLLYDDCNNWGIALTRYNMGYTNTQNAYSMLVLSKKTEYLNKHK